MFRIAVELGWLTSTPTFPGRLRENPPPQGFFEHHEYLRVGSTLSSAAQPAAALNAKNGDSRTRLPFDGELLKIMDDASDPAD
jgi:hypothetical protein